MRAVNLIPSDSRGRERTGGRIPFTTSHALLGLLGVAVLLVTIYVLTNNSISSRKARLATLQQQVVQAQAQAARLKNYAKFVKLAQDRIQTVRQIVSTRFDWHGALTDLSRVVPANTSLQSLTATVSPDSGTTGTGGGSGGSVRSAISAPAFELQGCTSTQDDVARLMSRLRLIDGVTRVTLANSSKQDNGQGGATVSTVGGTQGCGKNAPSFDLVVFFTPLPGAGPAASGSPGAPSSAVPASTSSTTASPTTTTAPTTASAPAGATPVGATK